MSSTTHQLQGPSHIPCSSNLFPTGAKLNTYPPSVNFTVQKSYSISKQGLTLRVSSELVPRRNTKPQIISAYQSRWQNHECIRSESESPKHAVPVAVSNIPIVPEDSLLAVNEPLRCIADANNIIGRSTELYNLFSGWLTAKLHKFPKPTEILAGTSRTSELLECSESHGTKIEIHKRRWDTVREVVSCYCSRLDATIKINMLIFIPCYVAVGVLYGFEVLKELTPLWIAGPLIVAFDIKMFQAISQLYIFSFKQAEIAIRSIPSPNKLTEATYTYISHMLVDMRSFNYITAAKLKLKEITRWTENVSELLFTLSWPFYWRIVSFLTRANLV